VSQKHIDVKYNSSFVDASKPDDDSPWSRQGQGQTRPLTV